MSGAGGALHLELVGVPVRVVCDTPELLERLRVCYADAFTDASDDALTASLAGDPGVWTIAIDGREPVTEADPVGAVRSFNHELLHGVMLRAPRFFYIHAGVASVAGGAVVLPGLSQAGKSTLVLALLVTGAQLLSDELLVHNPDTNCLVKFPRAVKIRDVCVDYFPDLAGEFIGEGEGRFLPTAALGAGRVVDSAPLSAVIVPRWNPDEDDTLAPISRGEALLALTESALNFGTHREASLAHLSAMVQDARTFRVSWRDPHRAAALIADALDG